MVKLGLFSLMGLYDRNTSPASVLRTTVDTVRMAEDMGFDVAWFAEHNFTNHSICPSSLLMVAHCAAETSRIRLGPAVLALPFYEPLRIVQEAAFADLLTRGRLVLGLGTGYQPYEFDRFRVDPNYRHQKMMEAWDIIEQGLTSGVIEYRGTMFDIPRTELSMRPFGLAMPEVFVASSHPELVARMARHGHTPFMSFGHRGLNAATAFRDVIVERWAAAGGNPATMPLAVQRYVYVTDDENDARHAAACVRDLARAAVPLATAALPKKDGPFLRLMPLNDEPPLDDFLENAVIGPAEYCAEKLYEEIVALKPTHLSCFMGFAGIGRRETLASMERFGCDVIPRLEGLVELRDVDMQDAA
ncbi:Flavin-dependent oxidoreductase, luciferase family (includes alkanesulfonate monooxygenase SsuD and methylene tetrahydromethanopterin reductase) [Pseudoxanthobacter soli DSM 19599]|uniref:Flavin-dependent oxidoreductase, luciferase family (Includes alkanesulfonate monooxygenase SsuD and methylene tetrahydromethanopterin reductase) n=1 Tax=Pseudoxanthobacter soli DSM 19599 TaxID=1123029 RepID=A0A1M7ZRM7_9HYPH|nr:LLM class flavin-dependent oxidoreductase [Pseudoxanthobacter soli]SHO67469.1 Flavin-dependent oxidoreductase, luciferase family (includes alkanesulfonate monooxygenase SsuD and methylene tetrahydromethanopterin reductase) [Pseudoxanthobacter soli DSM 19599]